MLIDVLTLMKVSKERIPPSSRKSNYPEYEEGIRYSGKLVFL
jgi:hypothetical protein